MTEFGRTVIVGIPSRKRPKSAYAICVRTDDPEHLTLSKLYRIKIAGEFVSLVDDQGEVSVYPSDFFVLLSLSRLARTQLESALSL